MVKVRQSKQELITHLHENLRFLKASASSFDSGYTSEAKRLAVTIRVLLHDTRKSQSLLGLLGWKQGFSFLDTALNYDLRNLMSHHGLVEIRLGDGSASYRAPLDQGSPIRPNQYVPFPEWWSKIVIVDLKKNKFHRGDLILALANWDGGAHVDPDLDEAYANLTRHNSIGWFFLDRNKEKSLVEVELFSVRQIAYEVISSVERKIAKYNIA